MMRCCSLQQALLTVKRLGNPTSRFQRMQGAPPTRPMMALRCTAQSHLQGALRLQPAA